MKVAHFKLLLLQLLAFIICVLIFCGALHAQPAASRRSGLPGHQLKEIPLELERFYQDINFSANLKELIDGDVKTVANPGYGLLVSPSEIWYEFPDNMEARIKKLSFYDGEGIFTYAPFKIYVISPGTWERNLVAVFTGEKYNEWVNVVLPASIPAKYLVIEKWHMLPNEMKLFGSFKPVTSPVQPRRTHYQFKNLLGINGFEWNLLLNPENNSYDKIYESKMNLVRPFRGGFRHYMDWKHIEDSPGKYTFNPVRDGAWNYDLVYERLKDEGIEALVCFKTVPDFIRKTYPEKEQGTENIPARYGADLSNPASYAEQARAAFQFVARYGYNKNIDPELIRVDTEPFWNANGPRNEKRTGLSCVRYIECENERDKWWKGRSAYQRGREYAANLSAFYDGHQGKLGKNAGVKSADPSCKVVIGGIASAQPDYIRAIIDWCKEFRNGDLCFDVINYHNGSIQYGRASCGLAPELSVLGETAERFLKLSWLYGQGKEVWITESGYDISPVSPQRAPAIGNRPALLTQADWILRTALLFSRKGIARNFYFELFDDNPGGGLFSSCGLADEKTLKRRPALDFILQAGRLLGEFRYEKSLCSNPVVDKYQYKDRSIYVLYSPTQSAKTIPFTLNFGSRNRQVRIHHLAEGKEFMRSEIVNIDKRQLRLKLTETPVFVEIL